MKIEKIDYSEVSAISFKDLSYIKLAPFLEDFYTYKPTLNSFANAIEDRKNKPVDRSLLTAVLRDNYAGSTTTNIQKENIDALDSENTFTIITAHQPSLFGGPLYYVLKICSVINLCNQLNDKYSDCRFVPTFVSGGEDHDFDEVDHLHLFGKTVKWDRESKGPVGRLDTNGLEDVIDEAMSILGDHPIGLKMKDIFQNAHEKATTYGEFVFKFVNQIFGHYGLLVVNMDDAKMKKRFAPLMKKELLKSISKPLLLETQGRLENHKFKAQTFPRDINLFYVGDGGRDRIGLVDGLFHIVDTELKFTETEMLDILDKNPEHFSPNVVMRPLYQEYILPNLSQVLSNPLFTIIAEFLRISIGKNTSKAAN